MPAEKRARRQKISASRRKHEPAFPGQGRTHGATWRCEGDGVGGPFRGSSPPDLRLEEGGDGWGAQDLRQPSGPDQRAEMQPRTGFTTLGSSDRCLKDRFHLISLQIVALPGCTAPTAVGPGFGAFRGTLRAEFRGGASHLPGRAVKVARPRRHPDRARRSWHFREETGAGRLAIVDNLLHGLHRIPPHILAIEDRAPFPFKGLE
jgi:hypothetical protein